MKNPFPSFTSFFSRKRRVMPLQTTQQIELNERLRQELQETNRRLMLAKEQKEEEDFKERIYAEGFDPELDSPPSSPRKKI